VRVVVHLLLYAEHLALLLERHGNVYIEGIAVGGNGLVIFILDIASREGSVSLFVNT